MHNRAQCKRCLEVVESYHRHDLQFCQCGAIAVDGGKDYLRRIGEPEDINEIGDDASRIIQKPQK